MWGANLACQAHSLDMQQECSQCKQIIWRACARYNCLQETRHKHPACRLCVSWLAEHPLP
jgi:hypothetical protein